jgi:hypothetical protein
MSMTAAGASWSNGCNRHFEIADDRSTQDGLWLGSLEGVGCEGHRWRYSITSSARESSDGGTARPSALAALRLMTRLSFAGC